MIHRVEPELEKQGQDPYVRAGADLIHRSDLETATGVHPWGAMDETQLLERIRELAEAEGLGLRQAACRFATVEVPREREEGRGWEWHPWFGFRPA